MNYYDLPQHIQYHLHTIELRECHSALQSIVQPHEVFPTLLRHLTNGKWEYELANYLSNAHRRISKEDRIFYYLVAGVGIRKVMQLQNVSQSRVYSIRDQDHDRRVPTGPLDGIFQVETQLIPNLQHLLAKLNVLDGYRVLDPQDTSFYNFSK